MVSVSYNQLHEATVKISVVFSLKKHMETVVQHNLCRGRKFNDTTETFPQGNATPEASWVTLETQA